MKGELQRLWQRLKRRKKEGPPKRGRPREISLALAQEVARSIPGNKGQGGRGQTRFQETLDEPFSPDLQRELEFLGKKHQ